MKTNTILFTPEDMRDGERIKTIFENLGEVDKSLVLVYISALRDKENVDAIKAG